MEILLGLAAILVLGIAPMVLYGLILWWFDRYEKEPLGLIVVAFLWGAVPAIIFSLISQLLFDIPVSRLIEPGLGAELTGAALIAPITEEPFKGLALLLLMLFFRKEIDSPLDGILYGGLVGFGFAATENVFYFLGSFGTSGLDGVVMLAVFRALLFGLNHALFTGCTGLGIALARTSPQWWVKISAPILGLLAGIFFHAIHNAGATLAGAYCWPILVSLVADWGGVILLFGILLWCSYREKTWIVRHLEEEVESGTFSRQDYHIIQSYWRRLAERIQALFRGEFSRWWRMGKYYRLATELAFAKHRLATFKSDKESEARIKKLRGELRQLRAQL